MYKIQHIKTGLFLTYHPHDKSILNFSEGTIFHTPPSVLTRKERDYIVVEITKLVNIKYYETVFKGVERIKPFIYKLPKSDFKLYRIYPKNGSHDY